MSTVEVKKGKVSKLSSRAERLARRIRTAQSKEKARSLAENRDRPIVSVLSSEQIPRTTPRRHCTVPNNLQKYTEGLSPPQGLALRDLFSRR